MKNQDTLTIICALSLLISCNTPKKQELDLEQVRDYIVTTNAIWSEDYNKFNLITKECRLDITLKDSTVYEIG